MSANSYVFTRLGGEAGGALLFAFHGTGGDDRSFAAFARELVPGATIIAPRGDVSEGGAARFFRRTGEGVYDMDDLRRATEKMAAFIEAHVERERPSRVLGLGYSNGANILASTMFARPKLFDAVALMHPLIPFQPDIKGDMAGRNVLITAGRADPICPPQLTSRLDAWLRQSGAEVALEWHPGGHEVRQSEIEIVRQYLNDERSREENAHVG